MKNGWFHETGKFAPETAVGTGAAEPLVDEVEAAEAVPSVDESTAGQGKNKPRQNENSDIKPSGENIGDSGTGEVLSTGEEQEVRGGENLNVLETDPDVNKEASAARPARPQDTKRKKTTTPPGEA